MAVYGLSATEGPFASLCKAFEACKRSWGDDPIYKDYRFQIEQAIRGLTLLDVSPGQRAAHMAQSMNYTGQEPTRRKEM